MNVRIWSRQSLDSCSKVPASDSDQHAHPVVIRATDIAEAQEASKCAASGARSAWKLPKTSRMRQAGLCWGVGMFSMLTVYNRAWSTRRPAQTAEYVLSQTQIALSWANYHSRSVTALFAATEGRQVSQGHTASVPGPCACHAHDTFGQGTGCK